MKPACIALRNQASRAPKRRAPIQSWCSGGYGDDRDFGDYILYTGHGGKDSNSTKQVADQSVDAPGNAGLVTSMIQALPVRVVRGAHKSSPFAPPAGYRYAGLFLVTEFIEKVGKDGFQIVQFRLDRLPEQDPYISSSPSELDPAYATTVVTGEFATPRSLVRLKTIYDFACQACGTSIEGFQGRLYAEGAHVRPLGKPHLGADVLDNLLCLCPNHHTQLDNGGLFIRKDMTIEDRLGVPVGSLNFKKKHLLFSAMRSTTGPTGSRRLSSGLAPTSSPPAPPPPPHQQPQPPDRDTSPAR